MATCLEKLCKANRWRIKTGRMGSDESSGWNGAFIVPISGDLWTVIISDGQGWKHLSVSNSQRKILPSWEIMCRLKDLFFDDESWVVQFHPAKSSCVDDHPYCLHLWESLNEPQPTPLIHLV